MKKCKYCGSELINQRQNKLFCSHEHHKLYENRKKFPDGIEGVDYVTCRICNIRSHYLYNDIIRHHKMTPEQYCSMFGLQFKDLYSTIYSNIRRDTTLQAIKDGKCHGWEFGDKNPSKRKEVREGRKSPFSMNYHKYDGLCDEDKKQKIQDLLAHCAKKRNTNHNNTTRLDYYTSRGYSLKRGKELLKKRQQTFSKKKCIEKYGREKGIKIWKERQEKWLRSLNNKSEEEKRRINISKFKGFVSAQINSYSKISQEMFDSIYDKIKDKFNLIQYATRAKGISKRNELNNYEHVFFTEDGFHCIFVDFFVGDVNKIIEFDGSYWHKDIEKDLKRDQFLKDMGYEVLRIKENEYRQNPKETIEKCIDFIVGN